MTAGSDICLPGTATDLIGKVLSQPDLHPALQLDKLSPATEKGQRRAIDAVCRCTGDGHLLKNLVERRRGMLAAFAAQRFSGKTAGALTLHLSRANALENVGLAFHPIYGFAFLPGSGLKGMTRAWAETVWKPDASDQQAAEARIEAAFGIQNAAGRIIFHDAWPVQWPQLEPDIVNCHHRDYYQQGKPPGDWENPVPVYFLTVAAGTQFEFTVSDRLQTADGLLEQVVDWMRLALEHAGIGAKTAAGYGRIVPCDTDSSDSVALPASCLRREHDLKLLSPAFLAGAKQERADCDLRPASLRGLLRWWWRTMHAHHMGSTDLAQFEALIWGDTQRGSAVSLSLTGAADNAGPVIYNRQTVEQNASPPKSGNRKTIQGLFYISWGMLPDNKQSGRHYRQPGDSWKLTLIARETFR
ncbi:MAG: type III-B CRISPR module RAMP protein Cmr6, partial [Hyphomonadaceae bacterium]|nr:type III-B CRISPR module RAMP protein Cmr6 [Hyphomonadaceae bacterium]